MNIIKILSSFRRRRPHTGSYFLQLPLDILLEILDLLPPHCLLVLYQTCRPLRTIIHQNYLSGRGQMLATLEDKLAYLSCLARSLPDRWVCAKCCKLHKVYCYDVPAYHTYTPDCEKFTTWPNRQEISNRNTYALHMPAHRHVQLSLKYTRSEKLSRKYRKILQDLLRPHYFPDKKRFYTLENDGLLEHSSYHPKIIDGRYIFLSIDTYLEDQNKITQRYLRGKGICHHIRGYEENYTTAIDIAFSAENTQVFFCCNSCRTDFSIQASPERVIISKWQDLGPEGTVFDPEWESLLSDLTSVYHQPGSIRNLYDQLENSEGYWILRSD
ncbi:hypothetical protein HDV63DRAFT_395854 [Trichoderma sp. SZMC 28014]